MAKPFLRYLPAKLQPLSAPAAWIPLTTFALISILLWEYCQNPDWFERDPILNANPESALTPDEQAKLSEIDTVDLLLKGAQASNPLSSPLSGSKAPGDTSDILAPVDLDAETAKGDRQLANRSDPFGAYASEYKFTGPNRSSAETSNASTSQNLGPNNVPSTASAGFGSVAESPSLAATPSALSEAIDRQAAIKAGEAQRNGSTNASPGFLAQPSGRSTAESFSQSGLSQSGLSQSGLSLNAAQASENVSTSPIQTTPAMSPLVGPVQNPPAVPFSSETTFPGQIGTVQASPIARPLLLKPTPPVGTVYTAPSSTQPEQNRRAR